MSTLDESQWAFLLLLARRVVPETADLDSGEMARFRAIIDDALALRPEAVQGQFGTLLKLLRWAPCLRYGRPLDRLPPERQDAVLRWFQETPLTLPRKGFWALKAMIFMGYYGREAGAASVGYTPAFSGIEKLTAGGGRSGA